MVLWGYLRRPLDTNNLAYLRFWHRLKKNSVMFISNAERNVPQQMGTSSLLRYQEHVFIYPRKDIKYSETNEQKIPHLVPRGRTVAQYTPLFHQYKTCCPQVNVLVQPLSLLFSSFISGASSSSSVLSWLFNVAERCRASNWLQKIRCYIADMTEWLRHWYRVTNMHTWQRNLILRWGTPAVFNDY